MTEKIKVNPFVNAFMRITGEWPLSGPPPLTQEQYDELYDSHPSFVDYLPVVDYDYDNEVYIFKDNINVAKMYEVTPRYMSAKSEDSLDMFNESVAKALNALPADDENPYIVQIYATKQDANDITNDLQNAVHKTAKNDALTQAVIEMNRKHFDILSHPKGIFPDSRLTNNSGWRIGEQRIYVVIYRKKSESKWKRIKKTPTEQLNHDLTPFVSSISSAGIKMEVLMPNSFINWLAPFFGNNKVVSSEDYDSSRNLASFDLSQKIFDSKAHYHDHDNDNSENGIWNFGDTWSRYLTLGGIEKTPRSGAITIGEQSDEGSSISLGASFFEKLPVGSMMSYSIIPQTDAQMKYEMSIISSKTSGTASRQSSYANEQVENAYEEMMRNNQKIFYAQIGIFLRADSLEKLLDETESVISEVKMTNMIQVVEPRWDLFPQNSYIRSLPCVYDFRNDRKATLRARKIYTSHLASILPFFGNKSGSNNPCYVMYTRTGEPFYINPFNPEDKERVSHEVFFGPTGSGKSATICYMTLMSMAINNNRTFLFDYGGSFKLLADFAEAHGKKVKRIKFTRNSSEVIAPFFETQKALNEVKQAQMINDGTFDSDISENDDEEEKRTYLGEMEAILRVMITGGNDYENTNLSQTDLSQISDALARGLQLSVDLGEPHARPTHIADAMQNMADEESSRSGGIAEIAKSMHEKAAALKRWTKGQHGILFNRTAEGFNPEYDLTLIEIGNLANTPDMMAVAGLSSVYNITAMAEGLQNSGRGIEVKIDEAHLWAKIGMLIDGLMVGSKVFRKLNTWLCIITQDVSDFKGDAAKILTNAEFWWLMKMSEQEINQITSVMSLSDEIKYLLKFPKKEKGRFVEGVSINEKYQDTLIRYVQPSLVLALAQTDGHEKEHRHKIMSEHQCSELDAAYIISEQIDEARKAFQSRI